MHDLAHDDIDFELSVGYFLASPDIALQRICELALTLCGKSAVLYVANGNSFRPVAAYPQRSVRAIKCGKSSDDKNGLCTVTLTELHRCLTSDAGKYHLVPIKSENRMLGVIACELAGDDVLSARKLNDLENLADIALRLITLEVSLAKMVRSAMEVIEETKM